MRRIMFAALLTLITISLSLAQGCGGGMMVTGTPYSSGTATNTSTATGTIQPGVVPPFGASSNGSGGTYPINGTRVSANGVTCSMIVPSSYNPANPTCFVLAYSGCEGDQTFASAIKSAVGQTGTSSFIFAILDGYVASANDGVTVMNYIREKYNIDNDKTYMLTESAGTPEGMKVGFDVLQSYFAAYWANDIICAGGPAKTAAQLGFAPWGNSGPGGDFADAETIVDNMRAAGYRLPPDAPYSGAGSSAHGSPSQYMAALSFFPGKTRR